MMLQTLHEAYVCMNADGVVTDLNPAAEATLGWSRSEALGRVLADTIIPQAHRGAHESGLEQFLATGDGPLLRRRTELTALHRDGHQFPVEITISATRDSDAYSFHAFFHDISERRCAEQYVATQQAVTATLIEAETVDAAIPRMLEAIGAGMGWDVGVHWMPGADGRLRFGAIWSSRDDMVDFERGCRELTFAHGEGLAGRVWRDGEPLFVADIAADRGFAHREMAVGAGLRAALGLPLPARDGVRGIVAFFARSPRHHEPQLVTMMTTLSAQIARIIVILDEREDALGRLKRFAMTDELTGLGNRRAWNEGLRRELARAQRRRESVCVAILDVDEFKAFNDQHGHQAGDRVLQHIAAAWRTRLRSSDLIARYGGEEFAVAFCPKPIDAALAVLERLRDAMPVGVTCSAGLASWDLAEDAEQLVGRADSAMYEAKRAGRNRTIIAQ